MKEHKVDSTKGKSVIDPLNYKNDVLTQAWVDSRVLATLMTWLDGLGSEPRTMSEIVRLPLKVLVRILVDNDEVKLVDDTSIARSMLEKRTGVDLTRGGKGGKNALHNVVLGARRDEYARAIKDRSDDIDIPRLEEPIHEGPEGFDMQKALELMEEDDE